MFRQERGVAAGQLFCLFRRPIIDIVGAHNIILTKVRVHLDLNQFERNLPRILKSVPGRSIYIVALTFPFVTLAVPCTTTQCSDR